MRIVCVDLLGVGWQTSFQCRRGGTTKVSIKKDVAIGLALKKGAAAFGYLGKDLNSNRSVLIFYLDGKGRDNEDVDAENKKGGVI